MTPIRTDRLKLLGSLLLLSCLILPMGQCTFRQVQQAPAPSAANRDGGPPDAAGVSQPRTERLYLVNLDEALSSGNMIRVAPFVFPVLLRLYQVRSTARRRRTAAYLLEVVAVLTAGYFVLPYFIFFEPLVGAYLGALAIVLYAAGWVLDARSAWAGRRARTQT